MNGEIQKLYEKILEQEKYLKRQVNVHAQLHNNNNLNNINLNNLYLQRRKLNIEDEELKEFHSDSEEEKFFK